MKILLTVTTNNKIYEARRVFSSALLTHKFKSLRSKIKYVIKVKKLKVKKCESVNLTKKHI